jgi:hypothetical protein
VLGAKGAIRATDGSDISLVPAAILLICVGLFGLAGLVSERGGSRAGVLVGRIIASVGVISGVVALSFVLTGTIPETDGAPAATGISYAVGAASMYLGQAVLGIAGLRAHALPGKLRWAPVGVLVFQFPVFIVAGAVGDGIGDETITDGLGMLLTGGLWACSFLAVWKASNLPPERAHVVGATAT